MSASQPGTTDARVDSGVLFGFAAYGMWGLFPLYFHTLAPATPWEILFQRILWSMLFCALAWCFLRDRSWVRTLLEHPHRIGLLTVAAYILAINWGGYIYAVSVENVVETSLGYFINPLVLVVMGVLLLHERLRPAQWVAIGIGALAVIVIAVDYGRPPWIALTLAFSFATYGFIKKRLGAQIGALESMTAETALLIPAAIAGLLWIEVSGRGTFAGEGPGHAFSLVASGPLTAVPLICFAAAARRVPLATMGMLQFLAPVLQLVCGVLILGEHVPPVRWIGFGLVWVALVILSVDSLRAAHARRQRNRAQVAAGLAG